MSDIMTENDGDGDTLQPLRPLKHGGQSKTSSKPDIIHDDDIEIIDDGVVPGKPAKDGDGGERTLRTEDVRAEREEEEADKRAGLTPEERKARADERRERRKQSKQRRRQRESSTDLLVKSLQKQVGDLTTQLHSVAERSDGQDLVQVQTAIGETQRYLQQAEATIKDAFAKQDGDAHTLALKAYTQAEKRLESLQNIEKRLKESPPSAALKTAGGTAMQALMQDWMGRNAWFDAKAGDEDSLIMIAVDTAVKRAGFDPNTPEYWLELDKRGAKRLPHRFRDGGDGEEEEDDPVLEEETPRRGGPPVSGGSRERRPAAPAGRKQYQISKARVEELKRTGVWDDPEQRSKYLKAYQKWDKANPQAATRR